MQPNEQINTTHHVKRCWNCDKSARQCGWVVDPSDKQHQSDAAREAGGQQDPRILVKHLVKGEYSLYLLACHQCKSSLEAICIQQFSARHDDGVQLLPTTLTV